MTVNGKTSLRRDLVGFLDYIDVIAVKRHGLLTRAVKKMSVLQSRSDRGKPWGLKSDLRGFSIETRRGLYEDVDGEEYVEEGSSEEEIPYVSQLVMKKKSADIGNGSLGGKRKPRFGVKTNVSFPDDGRNMNLISIREPNSKPSAGCNSTGDVKGVLESPKKRVEEMESGLASGVQDDEDEESESGVSAQTTDGKNQGRNSAIETDHKTFYQHPKDDDDDDNNDDEFTFPALEHLKMDSKTHPTNKHLKIKS